MKALDCESPGTAISSLSEILGQTESQIVDKLSEIDLNQTCEANPYLPVDSTQFLWDSVVPQHPASFPLGDIYWFHLTRVSDCTTFLKRGILPLGEIHDEIRESLVAISGKSLSDDETAELSRYSSCEPEICMLSVRDKLSNRMYHGPYALLVRSIAFCAASVGNHDYLRGPEIVEDICQQIARGLGLSPMELFQRYLTATKPCIVKFKSGPDRWDALQHALRFVYNYLKKEPHGYYTCFDAGGETIPPERIIYARFVDEELS